MGIKYNNILHSKALQNIAAFGFLVLKYIIWQPCQVNPAKRNCLRYFIPEIGHYII
jgi:hypothetical protein